MSRTGRIGTLDGGFEKSDEDKIEDARVFLDEIGNKRKWVFTKESAYALLSDIVSNPRGAIKDSLRYKVTDALYQLVQFLEDEEKLLSK